MLLERRGEVVSYEQLFDLVKTGRSKDNVRKHVATIRDALREIDPGFEGLENVPMRVFVGPAEVAQTACRRLPAADAYASSSSASWPAAPCWCCNC